MVADCFLHKNVKVIDDTVVCQDCGATGKIAEVNNMADREKLRGIVSRVKQEDKYWAVWIEGDDRRFSKFGKCHLPDLAVGDEVDFAVYPSKDGAYWNIAALGRIAKIETKLNSFDRTKEVEKDVQDNEDMAVVNHTYVMTKSVELAVNLLVVHNKLSEMNQAQREDELFRIASAIRDWLLCPE